MGASPLDSSSDVLDLARSLILDTAWCDSFEDRMSAAFDKGHNSPEMKSLLKTDDYIRWNECRRDYDSDSHKIILLLIAEVERLRAGLK